MRAPLSRTTVQPSHAHTGTLSHTDSASAAKGKGQQGEREWRLKRRRRQRQRGWQGQRVAARTCEKQQVSKFHSRVGRELGCCEPGRTAEHSAVARAGAGWPHVCETQREGGGTAWPYLGAGGEEKEVAVIEFAHFFFDVFLSNDCHAKNPQMPPQLICIRLVTKTMNSM